MHGPFGITLAGFPKKGFLFGVLIVWTVMKIVYNIP